VKKFIYILVLFLISIVGNNSYAMGAEDANHDGWEDDGWGNGGDTIDIGDILVTGGGGGGGDTSWIDPNIPDDPDPNNPDNPGGGGDIDNGGGGDNVDNSNPDVKSEVEDPCMKAVLDKIINGNDSNVFSKILNGPTFNDNAGLVFTQYSDYSPTGINEDGSARPVNQFLQIISLNFAALDNASNEYVAATIYHEIIHASLTLQGIDDQHNVMANEWLDDMSNQMQADFPNLTKQDADALAWGGLHETNAWKAMVKQDPEITNSIINLNKNHKNLDNSSNGNYGTSCK
jgi:hypothetical protein